MKKITVLISYLLLGVLYVLHQDLWFWEDPRIVLGMPVGLLYHLGFCLLSVLLLTTLVFNTSPTGTDD